MNNIDRRLLIRISQMYYDENKTQQEIANKMGLSRPTVSRLLQKAKDEGIVDIKINYGGSFTRLENDLEKILKIKEVIITPSEEGDRQKRILAEAGANFLTRALKDKDIIGVSWGTTTAVIPEYLQKAPKLDVTFVPLVGGVGQIGLEVHANQICINLAHRFGGSWQLLHVPAIVDNRELKDYLLADSGTKQVLDLARSANVAILGLGAPQDPHSTLLQTGYFSSDQLDELERCGAVCDLCSQFIDIQGRLCQIELNNRAIGIKMEELKKIPLVIGVAGGMAKHRAVLAAMRTNIIDVLITDEKTGQFLLDRYRVNH